MNDQPTDAQLIQQVLGGTPEAFRGLVERYQPRVYRVLIGMSGNPETACDATQETFLRAYRALERFDINQSFGAWIKRIAVNYMLDQWKKKKVWTQSLENDAGEMIDVPDSTTSCPHDALATKEDEEMVWNAIQSLPEKYRVVVVMRHLEDMRYEDIAATLGLPLGTVTTHLHRARAMLAELISKAQRSEIHDVMQGSVR